MESLDNYLQPRTSISDNVEKQYLLEVGSLCPLCGKKSPISAIIIAPIL